jgi:hypothetical protein
VDLAVTEIVERSERRARKRATRFVRASLAAFGVGLAAMLVAAVANEARSSLDVLFSFLAVATGSLGLILGIAGVGGLTMPDDADRVHHGPGTLAIERGGVSFHADGGQRHVAADQITEGFVDDEGHAVLRLRGDLDLQVACRDPADAPRLLAELGLGAEARTATFWIESAAAPHHLAGPAILGTAGATFLGALFVAGALEQGLAAVGIGRGEPTALAAALSTALAVLFAFIARTIARTLMRRTVHVGTDGLTIRGLWRRYLPYSRIVRLREAGARVLVELRSGGTVILPVLPASRGLMRRIEEARATRGRSAAAAASALAPEDRPVGQWRADLAKLVSPSADYREASVTTEDLAAVAEDAAQPAQQRIGAALALASSEDRGPRERVRIAARATEDPDLRAALEEAAEGEVAPSRLRRLSAR